MSVMMYHVFYSFHVFKHNGPRSGGFGAGQSEDHLQTPAPIHAQPDSFHFDVR